MTAAGSAQRPEIKLCRSMGMSYLSSVCMPKPGSRGFYESAVRLVPQGSSRISQKTVLLRKKKLISNSVHL